MQQVNHCPKMTALFDVDLKKIPHVVERRTGVTELPLLFDRSRLSIALRDDDPAQRVSEFAGDFLISWCAIVITKANLRVRLRRLEKNAPAIVGHLHVIKVRPAFGPDVNRGAQPDVFVLETVGPHVMPPVEIVRQPLFQSALQTLVFGKIYVVRNAIVKIHGYLLISSLGHLFTGLSSSL